MKEERKTVFTYAHIKWFYGQSERAYYLNYFINCCKSGCNVAVMSPSPKHLTRNRYMLVTTPGTNNEKIIREKHINTKRLIQQSRSTKFTRKTGPFAIPTSV